MNTYIEDFAIHGGEMTKIKIHGWINDLDAANLIKRQNANNNDLKELVYEFYGRFDCDYNNFMYDNIATISHMLMALSNLRLAIQYKWSFVLGNSDKAAIDHCKDILDIFTKFKPVSEIISYTNSISKVVNNIYGNRFFNNTELYNKMIKQLDVEIDKTIRDILPINNENGENVSELSIDELTDMLNKYILKDKLNVDISDTISINKALYEDLNPTILYKFYIGLAESYMNNVITCNIYRDKMNDSDFENIKAAGDNLSGLLNSISDNAYDSNELDFYHIDTLLNKARVIVLMTVGLYGTHVDTIDYKSLYNFAAVAYDIDKILHEKFGHENDEFMYDYKSVFLNCCELCSSIMNK